MSKLDVNLAFVIGINIGLLVAVIDKWVTLTNCPSDCKKISPGERIIGGTKVKIEKFSFVAAIVVVKHSRIDNDALQCGCCIISKKWVMSAAHCVILLQDNQIEMQYIVVASNSIYWRKGKKHPVEKMISNKHYNRDSRVNDTSLLKVKKPFALSHEKPIMLASVQYKYIENNTAAVFGWGYNESETKIIQDKLLGVDVTIFDQEYCTDAYGENEISSDMFCAGNYTGGKDACQFDSGGPVVANNVLIGIVSWGGICGDYKEPGVYARVSAFHSWFREVETTEKEKIGFRIENATAAK